VDRPGSRRGSQLTESRGSTEEVSRRAPGAGHAVHVGAAARSGHEGGCVAAGR